MKNILSAICLSVLLISCNSEKKQTQQSTAKKEVSILLPEKYIFRFDSVQSIKEKATQAQMAYSKQLFMQGLDLYVNQKKPAEAIPLFRQSLQYYPDEKTYNFLANAYVDFGDALRADSTIYTIVLGPDGDAEQDYILARIEALKNDTNQSISYLAAAFNNGFLNKKRLDADKCFDKYRNLQAYQALMVQYLKDDDALKAKLFQSFLATASTINFPYEMPKDSVGENYDTFYKKSFISYDYAPFVNGMEDGRFARMVSNEYIIVATFKVNSNIDAVLYKTIMVITDTLPPTETKIVTYNSTGTIIEEKTFSQFLLPTTLKTGAIDSSGIISIKEYSIKWKNQPTEDGYRGNQWLGEDFVSEEKYKIDTDGHFIPYKSTADVAAK
ncbi:MAG: tetratricopeptide repeat protein [Bacteroidia bacterium]